MFADGLTHAIPKTVNLRKFGICNAQEDGALARFLRNFQELWADHQFKFGGIITGDLRVIGVYPRGAFSSKIISSH